MKVRSRTESKLLERAYVEVELEGKAGKVSRKEAIESMAGELKVPPETVALLALDQQAGSTAVLGRFYVYNTADALKRIHPSYLLERTLTKEEREKLRQERKKAKAPAPAPEAKK